MAAPSETKVFRVSGTLIANPLNLTTGPDYGGTILGATNRVSYDPGLDYRPVRAEEYGGQSVEEILFQSDFIFGATFRNWEDDVLSTIFPNTSAGVTARLVDFPGLNTSGTRMSAQSIKLLFAPDRPTEHPGMLIYSALPLIEETETIRLSILSELLVIVLFKGLRDGTGRVAQLGLLSDMTL